MLKYDKDPDMMLLKLLLTPVRSKRRALRRRFGGKQHGDEAAGEGSSLAASGNTDWDDDSGRPQAARAAEQKRRAAPAVTTRSIALLPSSQPSGAGAGDAAARTPQTARLGVAAVGPPILLELFICKSCPPRYNNPLNTQEHG